VVAASVVGLETLLLVLFGLAELRSLDSTRATMGITTTMFFVVYGLGLGYCAWRLWRRESWARAPIVLAQLIQLGVAWSFRGGGTTVAAIGLALLALLACAGIFHPASLRALAHDADQPDQA
jgi:hypothetical protein